MKKKMITAMLIVSILLSAAAGATTFALPAQAAATVDKKISFMQELTLPTEEQYKYKDWKQTTTCTTKTAKTVKSRVLPLAKT